MLSDMESERLHLLKRLRREGCAEAGGEDWTAGLGVLLETGLIRTVERGGPPLIVLTGRGVQAAEAPYSD
jgi:hypothetical protein